MPRHLHPRTVSLRGPARVLLVERDAVDDVQVHLVEVHHLRPVQVGLPGVTECDLAPGGVRVLRLLRVKWLRFENLPGRPKARKGKIKGDADSFPDMR